MKAKAEIGFGFKKKKQFKAFLRITTKSKFKKKDNSKEMGKQWERAYMQAFYTQNNTNQY